MRVVSKVKWFSNEKGHGFLDPVDGSNGRDIFLHHGKKGYRGYVSFEKDDEVEFFLDDLGKGPIALEFKPISELDHVPVL